MNRHLFNLARVLVRVLREITRRAELLSLQLRGVASDSSAIIDSHAVFELSGGKISIGARTFIDRGVILRPMGGSISIGSDCSVHAYSVLYGGGGLRIGNNVRIATQTVIVPSNHIFSDRLMPIKDQGLSLQGIVIEDNVWIGAGARVLDGVILRKGTVVGAGAVVTRSTDAFSVVVGVPAKKMSSREK